jgi:hypothetical protein
MSANTKIMRRASGSSAGSNRQSNNRRGKIPVLESVSLHNLFPVDKEPLGEKKNKKFFRPEHASSLLHQVRLDIVIGSKEGKDNTEKKDAINIDSGHEQVIFSAVAAVKTVHPSWNHLDECIEDYLALDGYYDSETSAYRFMRLRIWLLPDDELEESEIIDNLDLWERQPPEEEGSFSEASLSENNNNKQKNRHDTLKPLLDISIHPTKLRRLATVPKKLPINSLILHFSDGSVRATRTLLDLVGDQDGSHSDENLKDEFGRFGDDVFRTLDSVTPLKSTKQGNHDQQAKKEEASPLQPQEQSILSSYSEDSTDEITDTFALPMAMQHKHKHKHGGKAGNKHQQELLAAQNTFASTEQDVTIHDENSEVEHLQKLIQLQEAALQEDLESLQQVGQVRV